MPAIGCNVAHCMALVPFCMALYGAARATGAPEKA